jgi:hypothetical protein
MTYFAIERLRFGDKLVLNTEICDKCNIKTKDAHYKFIRVKSIKDQQNN